MRGTPGARGKRRRYLHYFLVYNATPPHALLARSAPFCFPAAYDDRARCDLVQFVTTLTHGRAAAC